MMCIDFALEQRCPLEDAVVLDRSANFASRLPPEVWVGQLPTPELDGHLDPITVLQELDRPTDLRVEVALTDLRLEPDLLELDRPGLPLGLLVPLGQFVLVLAVVEEPCDGGEAVGATSTRS